MKKCINCNNIANHNHHIVPKSKGGIVTVDLCEKCHKTIHSGGVGSSYLTRLGIFRKQNGYFARLFYLITQETNNIDEIVNDFHNNGCKWITKNTIIKWISRMKKIKTLDLIESLNPILQMDEKWWGYFIDEWIYYCEL